MATSKDSGKRPSRSSQSQSHAGQQKRDSARRTGGSTGSRAGNTGRVRPSDTGRARPSSTGSVRAGNKAGRTGNVSSTNKTARTGKTGQVRTSGNEARPSDSDRIRTGNTGRVRTSNTGRMRPSSTGSVSSGSRPSRSGNTGNVRTAEANRVQSSQTRRARGSAPYRPAHAAPRPARRRRKGLSVPAIIVISLVVVLLSVGGFFVARNLIGSFGRPNVEAGQQVTVAIPEGSSGQDISQLLVDSGVISDVRAFRKAIKDQGADQSLRPGTYSLVTGSDPAEVVSQLVKGPNSSEGQLQVPEGLTVTQTAELVEESLGIKQDDFLERAKASSYEDDYPFLKEAGSDSLEGFLCPKTYDFTGKNPTADDVIRQMLTQYQSEMKDLDFDAARTELSKRFENINVTDYDILKIASIIEKEATTEQDRPLVSSVFYNRLNIGKYLESDATMGYVKDGMVTSDDLKEDSPYNTYLHGGLPPTPICSPSLWCIEAAMNPAETDNLFFFIIEDGKYSNHTFSLTYEEHEAAYAKALEEQAVANGKEPPSKSSDEGEGDGESDTGDTSDGEATTSEDGAEG